MQLRIELCVILNYSCTSMKILDKIQKCPRWNYHTIALTAGMRCWVHLSLIFLSNSRVLSVDISAAAFLCLTLYDRFSGRVGSCLLPIYTRPNSTVLKRIPFLIYCLWSPYLTLISLKTQADIAHFVLIYDSLTTNVLPRCSCMVCHELLIHFYRIF